MLRHCVLTLGILTGIEMGAPALRAQEAKQTAAVEPGAAATGAALTAADQAGKVAILPLNSAWKFAPDPQRQGVAAKWFAPDFNDSAWGTVKADSSGAGWRQQGFADHAGDAWYRQGLDLPAEIAARGYLFLVFPSAEEEADLYVNGQQVLTNTYVATGLAPGTIWDTPFAFDARAMLKPGAGNLVALRVCNRTGPAGGLLKPVFLVGSDVAASAAELCDFLVAKARLRSDAFGLAAKGLPPLPPHPFEASLGSRIPRTMTLLATSNKTCRRTVKILVYGQSITQGLMWKPMVQLLRKRYPYAQIVTENRSIGGFTAPTLVRTAVADLYPYYPDLVVFQVYGGETSGEIERIIYNIRKLTTAEILIFTHTVAWVDQPDQLAKRTESDDLSADQTRYLAQKYGCELVEAREEWREYLKVNGMTINQLMGDTVHSNVHPNDKGHTLLAELILRHFKYNPWFPGDWGATIRTFEARRPLEERRDEITFGGPDWQVTGNGIAGSSPQSPLCLKFRGNRVDVLAIPCSKPGTAKVLIDSKPPSSFPDLYTCTLPTTAPHVWWPAVARVDLGPNPVVEDWTLRLANLDMEKKTFRFTVEGSVTGQDGEGSSTEAFVSKSGRIRIIARDWQIVGALSYTKKPCPENFTVKWKVIPLFTDTYQPKPIADPALDDRYTLVQGLPNGEHTLELVPNGDGNVPVKAIEVHCPPIP